MDPFGVGSAELVAGSIPPFWEGVCKSRQGQSCHAFFKSWYEGYKDQVSPTTYESYGYTLKTLNRAFGSKPLRSIRASDVEAFLRDLTKDGTHQSQASKCRGMMFQIMRKAQANDLILKNLSSSLTRRGTRPGKAKRTPSQRKKSKSCSSTCRTTRRATA